MNPSTNIDSLRLEINQIDETLLKTFLRRFKLTEQVAEYKENKGLPTYDPEREKQHLFSLEKAADELGGESEFTTAIEEIFEQIMASSRALQDLKRGKKSYKFDPEGKYYCRRCGWNTPGEPGHPGSTRPICSACKKPLVPR